MRGIYTIFLVFFISAPSFGQLQDNFSDGDFTSNPSWSGDTGEFLVETQSLKSNGPAATSTLHLSTANTRIQDTEWRFLIDLRFAPSASNQARVYLVSNQSNLEGDLNGYYIEIGQSGDDFIKLVRQSGSTRTTIFTGTTAFAGNVKTRIKVLRNNAGQWQIFADPAGGESFVSQGAAFTDNTFTATAFFGLVCNHTTSNRDKFFFDDFYIGDEMVDNIAPQVLSAQVISATEVDITFSETVLQSDAETEGNYAANNNLNSPLSALRNGQNPAVVRLAFAQSFADGQENILNIQNIKDLNNNLLSPNPSTINFTYFEPFEAGFRDVLIHEIMADPTPTQGLPDAEFVELYNPNTKAVNLQNWTLSGAVLPNFTLAPQSYVLVCAQGDAAELAPFGDVLGLVDFNTLTNSGEEILLNDQNGQLIDRVEYNLTWYQDASKEDGGYSLEQINPNLPCSSADNWQGSNSALGGTPNQQNSVFNNTPDQSAPALLTVSTLNPTTIFVQFTESMDQGTLSNTTNYSLTNGISINTAVAEAPEFTSVQLTINPALQEGTNYTLNFNNLTDCSGNLLSQPSVTIALGGAPDFHELIITEIMTDPRGSAQPVNPLPETEFLELFNRSNRVLDLKDCKLADADGNINLPQQAIFPGEYVILVENSFAADFQGFGKVVGVDNFPDLLNSGEELVLTNPDGTLVVAVLYDDSWYQNTSKSDGGWALEMIDTDNPCGEASNWLASEADRGGTPGMLNSVAADRPDLTAPKLVRAEAIDALTIRLIFNEKMDENSLQNGQYQLSGNLNIQNISPEFPAFKRVIVSLSTPMTEQTTYNVTVDNVQDCSGNLIGDVNTTAFGLPEEPDSLDMILNELLFNPRTGGSDFVELYNNSSKFINLKGWVLANIEDGIPANQKIILEEEDYILAPQTYLVISNNIGNILNNYPLAQEETFLEISSMPSYPDDEGTFILISSQNQLIERFDYNEDFHFPLLDDEEGVSLERIAFNLPTNTRNSWQSAAATSGFATPGYQNSQQKRENTSNAKISINPQIFTPDGDGLEDFTSIDLDMQQGGALVDIIIYDAQGRLIKRLTQRYFLGTEKGTFIWDGTDESGNLARMGYYLAYIKILTPNGNNEEFKEKLVVGRRF
ncbi:MAG: lamin tail domain-containing protein [Microscillaceae bacterium]|nr:lamin tail domain-containing protein [Microscillaceae bacterium]